MSLQHSDPSINAIFQLLEGERDGAIVAMSQAIEAKTALEKQVATLTAQLEDATRQKLEAAGGVFDTEGKVVSIGSAA